MIRCRLLSDIHHEFLREPYQLTQISKTTSQDQTVLILAGDIGYPRDPKFRDFLVRARKLYDHVLLVAGNHEYYNNSVERINNELQKMCDELDCVYLNCSGYLIGKYKFLGCTLWSEIPPENVTNSMYRLNDFYQITHFTPTIFNRLHRDHKQWLQREIDNSEQDLIIVTHHGPSYKIVNPRYRGDLLNCCFVSDCEALIKPPVKAWFCGHTHDVSKTIINGIPVYLNCVGYPDEKGIIHHNPEFTFDLNPLHKKMSMN